MQNYDLQKILTARLQFIGQTKGKDCLITILEILGGFVAMILHDAPRATATVDMISVAPNT